MTVLLTENDVHVWYCHSDDPAVIARQEEYLALISADERARYGRFGFEKDRQLFLVARVLLRTVLSQYAAVSPAEWSFELTDKGKPFLAADPSLPPLRFNVSHSDKMAVCAVALARDVGVDVESYLRRADPRVARRVLSPRELDRFLAAHEPQQRDLFFRYWTLKESYVKAVGMGLSLRLSDFSFVLSDDSPPAIEFASASPDVADGWRFHQRVIGSHYYLAAAVRCPRDLPLRFRVTASLPLM